MRRLGTVIAALLCATCAHHGAPDIATLTSNSDQVIWEAGEKAAEKHNWESARQHFKRIIDGFPQSEYGPQARLALADSYFGDGGTGNYILAIAQYREFLTLYPSHPKSDYAQFRVAECYFKQRNSADRDQTNTEKALAEYERSQEIYPASKYGEQIRARIVECRQTLAKAEYNAGFFYQRTRQAYRAAISRYEFIVKEYPDYEHLDEVLFHLGECMCASNRGTEGKPYLSRMIESYPQSGLVQPAEKLLDTCRSTVAPPSPGPAASPSSTADGATASPSPTPSPSSSPPPRRRRPRP